MTPYYVYKLSATKESNNSWMRCLWEYKESKSKFDSGIRRVALPTNIIKEGALTLQA